MEAWREELYHGLFSNIKRAWKQHKYIRKEGNRYIYPEDLKNKNEPSVRVGIAPNSSSKTVGKLKLLSAKYDRVDGTDTYKGREARNALKDVKDVITAVNAENHGASDNKAYASRYYSDTKVSERYSVSLEYKNGKQWFDSMTVDNSNDFLKSPVPDISLSKEYDQMYTYNYGYFHQAYNSGKAFLDNLFKKKG